jgi:ATP-dependent helicase HrpB
LLEGENLGQIKFAADICAILSEMRGGDSKNSQNTDLFSNWEYFNRNRNQQRNVLKLSEQLCEQLHGKNTKENHTSEQVLERLLVAAYPDRICRKRKSGEKNEPNTQGRRAIMTTGLGVELTENSAATQQEFFIALQLVKLNSSQDMKVSLTCPISKSLITDYFKGQIKEESRLEFNEDSHKFQKTIQKKLLKMPMEEPRMTNATAEEVESLLPDLAMDKWDLLKSKNENLVHWLLRLEWYESKTKIKILNEKEIQAALSSACYGEKSLSSLFEKDLIYFFENELPRENIKNFHDSCPESLTLPSTKKVKVQYFPDKNPAVEARLQEFFGWKTNPVISHSSIPDSITKPIPLTLVLLGPNYRPVQITQDLGQFWKTSYLEIRKELRGRYPKHKWPDDPANFHFETFKK